MIELATPEDRIIRLEKANDRVTDGERTLLSFLIEDPGYTVS